MSGVIVGFDSRDESNDALALGQALADAYDAELHVAIVLPRKGVPFERAIAGGPVSTQLDEHLYGAAERKLGHADFTRARLDGELGGRSAARALYEYAGEVDADLIVVGSSHRGKLGRILPGSVGESLLRGAPCAVAIAPRGFSEHEHPGIDLIGVAYDGSDEAALALAEADRLSRSVGAKLRVITVVPTKTSFELQVALAGELLEDLRAEFGQILERGLSELGEEARSEGVLREGDPAVVLDEEARDLDLLVMGSRGYGPVRNTLVGAISSAVSRTASCPVLITSRGSAHRPKPNQGAAGHELAVEQ